MAKQAGDIFIEGTIDDLTFYKMCGKYYVRMKTSLTGKRFWKDKAFEGSRKSCSRFGEGNKLASAVFRLVEKEKSTNGLFPFLRTRAIALLKEEKPSEVVVCLLLDYLVDFGFIEKIAYEPATKAEKEDFDANVFTCKNPPTQHLQMNKTGFQKIRSKLYACAVGPPKVMGI
jgi:hypothetical protein